MCGIFLTNNNDISLHKKSLENRGPDMYGQIEKFGLIFGHKRLSIIDRSENGKQPILSRNKKFILLINGEIYNYKNFIYDTFFKNKRVSDSVIILDYIEKYGIELFLSKAVGMFAGILIDLINEEIYFFRDRNGEKPLDLYINNGIFIASSDIYNFLSRSNLDVTYNEKGILNFLIYRGLANKSTLFNEVINLETGILYKYDKNGRLLNKKPFEDNIELKLPNNFHKAFNTILKEYIDVDRRIVIPFSGGIDSTYLLLHLLKLGLKPKLIHFDTSNKFSETSYALAIAKFLKLDIKVIKGDIEKEYKNMELSSPIADVALLMSYPLFKEISKKGVVSISGDGGDEIFMGYRKAKYAKFIFKYRYFIRLLSFINIFQFNRRINLIIKSSFQNNITSVYNVLMSNFWKIPDKFYNIKDISIEKRDRKYFLEPQVLPKVDRSSMRYSVENRSPFLDSRLIKKFRGKYSNKNILKEYILDEIPKKLIEREKHGFVNDISSFIFKRFYNLNFKFKFEDSSLIKIANQIQKLKEKKHESLLNYQSEIYSFVYIINWFESFEKRRKNNRTHKI